MSTMASHITGVSAVCSTVCSGTDQRKHQGSASLAFVRGIHRWPVNFPHKGPVTRKMFPFDDVIMNFTFDVVNKQSSGWWFGSPWRSCDVTVVCFTGLPSWLQGLGDPTKSAGSESRLLREIPDPSELRIASRCSCMAGEVGKVAEAWLGGK